MTDEEILLIAVREARAILASFIEPGPPADVEATINDLLAALDHRDVVAAADRTEERLRRRLQS